MANKGRPEEASAGVRRVTKRIFEFYALLATQFSLRRRQIRQRGARRYISINPLTIRSQAIRHQVMGPRGMSKDVRV